MAKGSKKKRGSMMNMRSGFKRMAGGKGRKGKKKQAGFLTVLTWVFGVAFLMFLVWSLSR